MKKILLLSDTHSYIDDQILKFAEVADEIWHAGDIGNLKVTDTLKKYKPLRAVFGNIDDKDTRVEFSEDLIFEIEKMKVYMTHIGGVFGRYQSRVRETMVTEKPSIFICGHSHILKVQFDKKYNVLYLNPGAAGKHGFHSIRTMLRFELDSGIIKNLEIIELAKRN